MIQAMTWSCAMENNQVGCGYDFVYEGDDEPGGDTLFSVEVCRGPSQDASELQDYNESMQWVAQAFIDAVKRPGALLGFQIVDASGEYFNDRASFEVIDPDLACQDLLLIGKDSAQWALTAVYEGDIEEPYLEWLNPEAGRVPLAELIAEISNK